MKKALFYIGVLASLFAIAGATACKNKNKEDSSEESSEQYSVSLSSYTLVLDLYGEYQVLEATTHINNTPVEGEIVWASGDENVVAVQNGILYPVKVGATSVTASWEGKTATCEVSVQSDSVPVIKVNQTSIGFVYGVSDIYELDTYVLYKGEAYREGVELAYSTSDSSVVTVSQDGVLTPVGVGETEVKVQASFRNYSGIGMSTSISVSVYNDAEISAKIAESAPEVIYTRDIVYGEEIYQNKTSFEYSVSVMNDDALVNIPDAKVVWKTSDESIATITANGELTGKQAGEVLVWCEYDYNGYSNKSNAVKVEIKPYAVVETIKNSGLVFSKDKQITSEDLQIFGTSYTGLTKGVYYDETNYLETDGLNVSGLADGKYFFEIVNEDGYAFKVESYVASVSASADEVYIALMRGQLEKTGDRYYNLVLPAKDQLLDLLEQGYKALTVGYRVNTNASNNDAVITSRYASELQKAVLLNQDDSFVIYLRDLYERYEELNEFVKSEYIFKLNETYGEIALNSCALTTNVSEKNVEFRLDRSTKIGGPDGEFTLLSIPEKAGESVQFAAKGQASVDGLLKFDTKPAVSKNVMAQWLAEGYNCITIKYYLEYDATRMTKNIVAYTREAYEYKIGEEQVLKHNQWATMTFRLDRYFALVNSAAPLFVADVFAADDETSLDYTLYISSISATKTDEAGFDDIRFYAGYYTEMWNSINPGVRGVNEYEKQIGDKVANFYTKIDVEGIWQYGCYINFFNSLNVSRQELEALRAEGYTKLEFDIYAKTNIGVDTELVVNPQKQEVYHESLVFTLTNNGWTKISIDLDLLIQYYEVMNQCVGNNVFWSIRPYAFDNSIDTVIYEFGVGTITPSK